MRQNNKMYVPLASVMDVRNSQSLVSKHKGNRKKHHVGKKQRKRKMKKETPIEWDTFFQTYATHTFTQQECH